MHSNFKKIFFGAFAILLLTDSVFAQATTTSSKYANDTVLTEANRLCAKYTGFQSVYQTASAGGGGSVPVDLTQLRPILESIDRNTQLTANEIRIANTIRFCDEAQNMAKANNKLANDMPTFIINVRTAKN